MSYASLIKMSATLRQPIGLAVLSSIGIHGLLWSVLPVLPLESKQVSESQRTVGLIELTPAEQSRLPQFAPPPSTNELSELPPLPPATSELPPLPEQSVMPPLTPTTSELPPLPALPSNISSLPNSTTYPPIASLPSESPLPPPPSSLSAPPNETTNKYQLKTSLRQLQNFPEQPLPTPPQNNQSLTPPSNLNQPEPPQQRGTLPPPPSAFKPPINNGLPTTTGLKPALPFSPSQTNSVVAFNQPKATLQRSRQELIAALWHQRLEQQSNRSSASPTTGQVTRSFDTNLQAATSKPENTSQRSRQELIAALRQRLGQQFDHNPSDYISEATAQKIAMINDWSKRQSRVREENPDVVTKAPIYKKIETCQKQLDGGVAILGVVVNPKGNIISEPEFIGQVTPAVQQAAAEYVKRLGFSGTDKPTNYQFHLDYKYNTGTCSEASSKPTTQKIEQRKLAPENPNTDAGKLPPENLNTNNPKPASGEQNIAQPK